MRLSVMLFAAVLLLLFVSSSALSSDHTYQMPMVPLATTDAGTGVYAVGFNAPYQAVRHVVSLSNIISRVSFETVPQLPVGATLDSWSYTLKTPVSEFPSWLTFVSSWAGSSEFALLFNGTQALMNGTDPEAFTFELRGSVFYTHGPSRFVEQEQRVVRIIAHMHVQHSLSERMSVITQYFNQGARTDGVLPLSLRNANNRVPSFTLEDNERYIFACGGSLSDFTGACQWGDEATSPSPIWASELSHITVERGVLRIRAPLATWGAITIRSGAALVLDGPADTTSLAIFGWGGAPQVVNDGTVAVQRGVLRLSGTTAVGSGIFVVGRGATLELDPRTTSTLLDTASGQRRVAIYSEGTVTFASGEVVLGGALVSVGLGVVTVGMTARVVLTGTTGHVIGGVETGAERLSDSPGVNELALILSGAIRVERASLRLGAAARAQGLGYLSLGPSGSLTVDVEWYGSDYPDAGYIASGPPLERPVPGLHVDGGEVKLVRGGLTLASGVLLESNSTVDIGQHGFLRLSSEKAHNEFSGAWVVNNGDFLLLAGASVDINTKLTSTTHIRALESASTIFFSSRTPSILSRPPGTRVGSTGNGLAVTPTHLFALYCAGAVVIRDGAKLELTAEEPGAGLSSGLEPARFYAAAVANSGSLVLSGAAKLETTIFEQRAESAATGVSASKVIEDGYGPLFSQPWTHLASLEASVIMVNDGRYKYEPSQGLIKQRDTTTTSASTTRLMSISLGAVGGIDGSTYRSGLRARSTGRISPGAVYGTGKVRTDGVAAEMSTYTLQGATMNAQSIAIEGGVFQVELVDTGSRMHYDQIVLSGDATLSGAILHLTTNLPVQVLAAADITALANGRAATTTLAEAAHAVDISSSPSISVDIATTAAVAARSSGELFRIPIIVANKITGQFSGVRAKRVTSPSAVPVSTGSTLPLSLREGMTTMGMDGSVTRDDDVNLNALSAGPTTTTFTTGRQNVQPAAIEEEDVSSRSNGHTATTLAAATSASASAASGSSAQSSSITTAAVPSTAWGTHELVTTRASVPSVSASTVSVALEYSADGKSVYLVGYSGLGKGFNSASTAGSGVGVGAMVVSVLVVMVGMLWMKKEDA